MGLVLTRREGEMVHISGEAIIQVKKHKSDVRLWIKAPDTTIITRVGLDGKVEAGPRKGEVVLEPKT
jgi:sRNA-binding carbon storage regulator CsrA